VDTDMNPHGRAVRGADERLIAVERYGHGDEIAAMVAYLASPEASFVTGASLRIDGGLASSPRLSHDRIGAN